MNITRLHPMAEDYLAKLEAKLVRCPTRTARNWLANYADISRQACLTTLRRPTCITCSTIWGRPLTSSPLQPQRAVSHRHSHERGPTPPTPGAPARTWGILEILAVVGLTLGTFLVPVVGPLAGIALAWASTRWTRSEKIVATVLAFPPVIALVLGAVAFAASLVATGPGTSVRSCPACSGRSGAWSAAPTRPWRRIESATVFSDTAQPAARRSACRRGDPCRSRAFLNATATARTSVS